MMLVQMPDGASLRNPVFFGPDWFLRCTDDGLEFVIRTFRKPSSRAVLRKIRKLARDNGFDFGIIDDVLETTAAFPPNYKGLRQAASVQVTDLRVLGRLMCSVVC